MRRAVRTFSGTKDSAVTKRELENRAVARKAAAEGIVLMKNDGVLPLKKGSRVALLGSGAGRTVKGGTGSGDVNEREVVSIFQGMENAGFQITGGSGIMRRFTGSPGKTGEMLFSRKQKESRQWNFSRSTRPMPMRCLRGRPSPGKTVRGRILSSM